MCVCVCGGGGGGGGGGINIMSKMCVCGGFLPLVDMIDIEQNSHHLKSCHLLGANNGANSLLSISSSEEAEVVLRLRRGRLPFPLALWAWLGLTIVCRGRGREEGLRHMCCWWMRYEDGDCTTVISMTRAFRRCPKNDF